MHRCVRIMLDEIDERCSATSPVRVREIWVTSDTTPAMPQFNGIDSASMGGMKGVIVKDSAGTETRFLFYQSPFRGTPKYQQQQNVNDE